MGDHGMSGNRPKVARDWLQVAGDEDGDRLSGVGDGVTIRFDRNRDVVEYKIATTKYGIDALTRTIIRIVDGEDVSPNTRAHVGLVLRGAMVRIMPNRSRRGRAEAKAKDLAVQLFIDGQIRKHPDRQLKAIYGDAGKEFRLSLTQIRDIWRRRPTENSE
jgi:hypothetical protein